MEAEETNRRQDTDDVPHRPEPHDGDGEVLASEVKGGLEGGREGAHEVGILTVLPPRSAEDRLEFPPEREETDAH